MGYSELAIGNTGAQLVSKFNGNFGLVPYIYNVEEYGAVHDGVTDDTEAIQDTINDCADNGGGTVYFPNGVYLIAGALKNDVVFGAENVDYNSQLYIPACASTPYSDRKGTVRLLGESGTWHPNLENGVIWKSTIAGSGTWPSVICSRSWSGVIMNYTDVIMENISIRVNPFLGTTGISMCGVNFLWASHAIVRNVSVGYYVIDDDPEATLAALVKPANHAFGIGMGITGNDFGEMHGSCSARGFYYGFVLGEGINADCTMAYNCYIGMMLLSAVYGCAIRHHVSNWCTMDIAGQLETVYDTAGENTLIIQYCSIERWVAGRGPAWLEKEYYIKDPDNYLFGKMDFRVDGGLNFMSLRDGGTNFLTRNVFTGNGYHWTTANRPSSPDQGLSGFNLNTYKMEYWNGTSWKVIATE